jgi:glutamate synthase domain-containing protein 2
VLLKFIIYIFCSHVDKSTYQFLVCSYCGAQIFEIYGLGKEVVDLAFCGSVSKVGGLTFDEVRKLK